MAPSLDDNLGARSNNFNQLGATRPTEFGVARLVCNGMGFTIAALTDWARRWLPPDGEVYSDGLRASRSARSMEPIMPSASPSMPSAISVRRLGDSIAASA